MLRRSRRAVKERRFFCPSTGGPGSLWVDNPTSIREEELKHAKVPVEIMLGTAVMIPVNSGKVWAVRPRYFPVKRSQPSLVNDNQIKQNESDDNDKTAEMDSVDKEIWWMLSGGR